MINSLVVIPLYNKENTIKRTVLSILDQKFQDFTLLIVNDGSTDNSIPILESIKDSRIKIIHQNNKGVSAARNKGIEYALKHNYKFLNFIDGDDYWLSKHLNIIDLLFKKNSTAQVAATNYIINNSGSTIVETKFSNIENHSSGILHNFFEKNYLNSILTSSSFCIRVSILNDIKWYNEDYTHGEDTDFFIRLGMKFKIAFSLEKTVCIDKNSNSRSNCVLMKDRNIFNTDIYEDNNIPGLKKYLDLNKFSMSINARMEGHVKLALFYQQKIDLKNLSLKQKKLLDMSVLQLKALYKTKKILKTIGVDLRTA